MSLAVRRLVAIIPAELRIGKISIDFSAVELESQGKPGKCREGRELKNISGVEACLCNSLAVTHVY